MPFSDIGINSLGSKEYNDSAICDIDGPLSSSSSFSQTSFSSTSSPHKSLLNTHNMGTNKYELEDYIYEMECKQNETTPIEEEDVYTRLERKEKDLILAAELGKALLERNEILVEQNEKLAEEYSHKLEILEQDKHVLKRKLASTESEYDIKIQELSVDLQCARQELEEEQDNIRQAEREKIQVIDELTEQNLRLTNQVKEASKREEQLNAQLKHLRDQFNARRTNISEQVLTLDVLRDEITLLTDKKMDLERRIDSLVSEREGLSVTLDESSDRIVYLEKQSREKEQQLRVSQRDLEDLRHTNLSLTDRLEAISRNSSSPSIGHTSLMNEIDMSDQEVSRPHSHPSLPEDLIELDEEIECDEPILPLTDAELLKKLRQEMLEGVVQLRVLADQMRHRRRNSLTSLSTNSSDEVTISNIKVGMLDNSVKELKGLIREVLRKEAQGHCSACGREDRIQLEQEVHRALETLDKLNLELSECKDSLKSKTSETETLKQQMTLKDAELKAIQEERDNLRGDLQNTELAKDEIVKKAWDMRDNAVARKNACEIELAKTRIDVMQVNSQLMEAIQQKIELSQQLEQWQVDMQQLLDDQMRRKLHRMEAGAAITCGSALHGSDSDSSTGAKSSNKRNFKFLTLLATLRRSNGSKND